MLRSLLAPNPSPMTLDGTRTYVVGRRACAIIDPGPDDPRHLDAVTDLIGDGVVVAVLVTHGHPDHDESAHRLADRLNAPHMAYGDGALRDGDAVTTDTGELVVLHTPGHTPDHVAFAWPAESAIFCGDLMMGGLDTALVAPPEGNLADYLASLDRLASLSPKIIYPAHGAPFRDPGPALTRYRDHRRAREVQVLTGLGDSRKSTHQVAAAVYGDEIAPALRPVAEQAVVAYLDHLVELGKVCKPSPDLWERVS